MKFVKVKADKPITGNSKTLGEQKVSDAEYPQFESPAEFEKTIGGADKFTKWLNKKVANDAKNVGRALLRTPDESIRKEDHKAVAELHQRVRDAMRNYTPDVSSGESVKAKAEQRDKLVEMLKGDAPLTRAEILALLEG